MKYVALLKPDNDLIIQGITCIVNLQELYTNVWLPECSEIEIRQEFADKYFTYQGLIAFINSIAAIFPDKTITVENSVYKNIDTAARDIMYYETPQEFEYALTRNPKRTMQTVHELCRYYFDTQDDSMRASNKLATFLMQVTTLEKELETKNKQLDDLTNRLNNANATIHALGSRMAFQYNKTTDVNAQFELDENQFIKVLYIKEISRVHYTDTLLYYLSEIVQTLYGEPIRQVVIGPYYSYMQHEMYPGFKPHWNLTYQDVYDSNIYMAGFQPKVTHDILQNANHVHFLVVLDRSGCNAPFIKGNNVEVLYTVSDLKDAASLDKQHVISYSDETLYIPYIEDFENNSSEDKIKKYSTMPIMKTLIEYLERR